MKTATIAMKKFFSAIPFESWLPIIAGTVMAALLALYYWTFRQLPANENPVAWGTFGDYIGGLLNPLISLFTLVVAVKVWRLQKTELLETRKAIEEQGKTAKQQRCEQRFFDLLNTYQDTLKSFATPRFTGKSALSEIAEIHTPNSSCSDFLLRGFPGKNDGNLEERQKYNHAKNIVENYWKEKSPKFSHYFRVVFTILRELENLLEDQHWRYAKIFRAQLSNDELTLLAFNLIFNDAEEKLRPLVIKYGLLKHLERNKLRDMAIDTLSPTAFGRTGAAKHLNGEATRGTPC